MDAVSAKSNEVKNEEALAAYSTQWNALEEELKGADVNEKIKKVALGKFNEIRKLIADDVNLLKTFSYESFVSLLAHRTEKLADIVSAAKVDDAIFGIKQENLLDKEKSKPRAACFSAEDLLIDLGSI